MILIFFILSQIFACPGNLDPLTNCATCINHWINIPQNCNVCPPNIDIYTNCKFCRNHWNDITQNCILCPKGFNKTNDCNGCTGYYTGPQCDICPGEYSLSKDCSEISSYPKLFEFGIFFTITSTIFCCVFCCLCISICVWVLFKSYKDKKLKDTALKIAVPDLQATIENLKNKTSINHNGEYQPLDTK